VLVALALLATAAPAFAAPGPPTFIRSGNVVTGVHATRASIATILVPHESTTTVRIEYTTEPANPASWVLGGTLTCEWPRESSTCSAGSIFTHLTPLTHYSARAVAKNAFGEAEATGEFTTTAIEAPEFLEARCKSGFLTYENRQNNQEHDLPTICVAASVHSTRFYAEVESNGAETAYHFESSTSKSGPWTPVSGAEGNVTVAEDFAPTKEAHLTGLGPETTYYIRALASNEKDEGDPASLTIEFQTLSVKPTAGLPTISKVTLASAHLLDSVYPGDSETHWRFETATSESGPWGPGPEGAVTQAEADAFQAEVDAKGLGETPRPTVEADLSALSSATVYYVRLFAENEPEGVPYTSTSEVRGFETAGPPAATTFATHAIHGEAVRLLGSLTPRGFDTHYRFQYVTQEEFEHAGWANAEATPELDAGSGTSHQESQPGRAPVLVFNSQLIGADLPALQPGETYRYRLAATNTSPGNPVVHGAEQALIVPVAPEPAPAAPCQNEALRTGLSAHLPDCRAYEQLTPIDKEGAQEAFTYLANAATTGALAGADGEHFVLQATSTNWGSGQSPYFFSRAEDGWQMTAGAPQPETGIATYEPRLFTPDLTDFALSASWFLSEAKGGESPGTEYKAGPPGGPYATIASVPRSEGGGGIGEGWAAASKDFSKLFLQVPDHTLLGPPTGTARGDDLYEYSGGELHQVNVTTGSPGATIGACGASMVKGTAEPHGSVSSPHAVSTDGSRVFFEAVPGSNCSEPTHLYMRTDGAETTDIGAYAFLAANPQATEALLEKRAGETREFLLYKTESATLNSLFSTPSELKSLVVSEDLTAIYFESKERLTPEAPAAPSIETGEPPATLYRYDIAAKTLRFLLQTVAGSTFNVLAHTPSPDGRYYYFLSEGVGGLPGGGLEIGRTTRTQLLYRYDSAQNIVECVSCASPFDPEPRLGFNSRANTQIETAAGGDYAFASADGDYAFFATPAALVPQDHNGEVPPEEGAGTKEFGGNASPSTDVYEWRRAGLHGCAQLQGCLSLITPGAEGYLVALLGISAEGRDVFFTTHSQLLPRDNDTAGDIYNARIGGGFAEPTRPVECEGDACSTPFVAPNDLTPSSSTFHGAGNLLGATLPEVKPKPKKIKPKKKTKKKPKKKAKPKSKKKAGKKAKKSSSKRRAKRVCRLTPMQSTGCRRSVLR
jgi:hypothetical protein